MFIHFDSMIPPLGVRLIKKIIIFLQIFVCRMVITVL